MRKVRTKDRRGLLLEIVQKEQKNMIVSFLHGFAYAHAVGNQEWVCSLGDSGDGLLKKSYLLANGYKEEGRCHLAEL